MREIATILFVVDDGITPKIKLKQIIESGCGEEGYDYDEISLDSSGDMGLYFKVVKEE